MTRFAPCGEFLLTFVKYLFNPLFNPLYLVCLILIQTNVKTLTFNLIPPINVYGAVAY